MRTQIAMLAAMIGLSGTAAADAPKVGDTAANFTLNTIGGAPISLAKMRADGPVVLVVLRGYPGYQCPLCTKQVADLMRRAKAFEAAKAQVLLVYPGPAESLAEHAKEFLGGKTEMAAPFTLAIDPDYTFTNLYNLRWDAENETAYPSTFVIDPDGKIRFAKVSKTHDGRAGAKTVLEALTATR